MSTMEATRLSFTPAEEIVEQIFSLMPKISPETIDPTANDIGELHADQFLGTVFMHADTVNARIDLIAAAESYYDRAEAVRAMDGGRPERPLQRETYIASFLASAATVLDDYDLLASETLVMEGIGEV